MPLVRVNWIITANTPHTNGDINFNSVEPISSTHGAALLLRFLIRFSNSTGYIGAVNIGDHRLITSMDTFRICICCNIGACVDEVFVHAFANLSPLSVSPLIVRSCILGHFFDPIR